tara:strand:- start:323 stop:1270 length:948 start_codon:yes stop_codon:yes gene_type:complete
MVLGTWFKNNFSYRLSSERNIYRVYEFNFTNYKGESLYKRDNNAFRYNERSIKPNEIDIIFSGGSTTNQKFLNYEDTIVGYLDNFFKNIKFVNAGIDGLSIRGHINSFDLWFNKIDGLNPKYFIFYIGVNDRNLLDYKEKSIDKFEESDFKSNLREYLESNSFLYKKFRFLKATLYLKFNIQNAASVVNKKNVVYGERSSKDFILFDDFESSREINKLFYEKYMLLLNTLTNKVREKNAIPIYITQISGYGINEELFSSAKAIMEHCRNQSLKCINLAKEIDLNYEDFYDDVHLNPKGSFKVFSYLSKKLEKIIN